MPDVFATPTVQAALGVLVLCVLIAAGFYLVSRFRDYTADDRENSQDVLANLREMHRKGDISDEEFRTIEASAERQSTRPDTTDDFASQAHESSDR